MGRENLLHLYEYTGMECEIADMNSFADILFAEEESKFGHRVLIMAL